MHYSCILVHTFCIFIVFISSFLTKVLPLKKLWKKYYICALFNCIPYKSVGCFYIFQNISATLHLYSSNSSYSAHIINLHFYMVFYSSLCTFYMFFFMPAGICCVMQCILPPPTIMSLAYIPVTFLSGISFDNSSIASLSFLSPNCGTSTFALDI